MNLKSIAGNGLDKSFAYLIEPSAPVKNDNELYALINKHGRAVIRPFEGTTFKLNSPQILTPQEFETTWQGD